MNALAKHDVTPLQLGEYHDTLHHVLTSLHLSCHLTLCVCVCYGCSCLTTIPCGLNVYLAVWQNQLAVAEYLCGSPGLSSSSFSLPPSAVRASPLQVNAFACALPHWLATATREVGGEGGVLLLPMAEWVSEPFMLWCTELWCIMCEDEETMN